MVSIRQSDRHNHMSHPYIKSWKNQPGDMKLFQSHFSSFLYFCLVFPIFRIFQFYRHTCTTGFKFDLSTEYPFRIELIVKSQYKTGNRNRIPVLPYRSIRYSGKPIHSIVHEISQNLTISTETESFKTGIFTLYFFGVTR